jgi:hypothetical protein
MFKHFNERYFARDYPAALIEAQKYEAAVKARYGTDHVNYTVSQDDGEKMGRIAEIARCRGDRAIDDAGADVGRMHEGITNSLQKFGAAFGRDRPSGSQHGIKLLIGRAP